MSPSINCIISAASWFHGVMCLSVSWEIVWLLPLLCLEQQWEVRLGAPFRCDVHPPTFIYILPSIQDWLSFQIRLHPFCPRPDHNDTPVEKTGGERTGQCWRGNNTVNREFYSNKTRQRALGSTCKMKKSASKRKASEGAPRCTWAC